MIENVPGFLSANDGEDWRTVVEELRRFGHSTTRLIVDAAAFAPKSRARVFLFGHKGGLMLPEPPPARDDLRLAEAAEWDGDWWPAPRLGAFLTAMSVIQSERVTSYRRREVPWFFGFYRRTRDGRSVWEVRADERTGALRRRGAARQSKRY